MWVIAQNRQVGTKAPLYHTKELDSILKATGFSERIERENKQDQVRILERKF